MKHTIMAGFAAAAFTVPLMAQAADMPVKAPLLPPVAVYNWTGCYVGAYGGSARGGRTTLTDRGNGTSAYNDSLNHSWTYTLRGSASAGGTLGCNWQSAGSAFVLGVEGEAGYLRLRGSAPDPTSPALDTVGRTQIGNFDGILAARVGFAADRVLFYGKGGIGFVRERDSVIDVCSLAPCGAGLVNASSSSQRASWAGGGGIEYAWSGNWSLKAEYLFLSAHRDHLLSGVITAGPATGVTTAWNEHLRGISTVRVGLNYHFGGGSIATRY